MHRKSIRVVCAVAVTSLIFGSCRKSREHDDTKVTVSSTDDATQPIEDNDYRFRIAWPGAGWKLMRENDIRRVSPDAVAGAVYRNEVFGVIIVESAPGVELEPYARVLLDNMPLEGKSVESFDQMRYQGMKAVRFTAKGSTNGMPFLFQNTVFLHQGFAYQVLAWGISGQTETAAFKPFVDAFSITPGEVEARVNTEAAKDTRGVGWHLKDGVFQSAVSGVVVEPKGAWRVAIGGELARINADAEVGVIHAGPDVYLVLIPERAPGVDKTQLTAKLQEDLAATLDVEPKQDTVSFTVAGAQVAFKVYEAQGQPPMEYLHAVHYQGDVAIQVFAWYMSGHRAEARKALPEGLSTLSFLDVHKTQALADAVLAEPDPENVTGPGFSLRGGTFRSFEHAFSWRKPRGFWRAVAGERARAVNQAATLYLYEPTRGLYGLVIAEPAPSVENGAYHQAVVAGVLGEAAKAPVERRIGGADALLSTGDADVNDLHLRYRILTMVEQRKALQFLVWGHPGDMDNEAHLVDEVFAGLSIGAQEPVEHTGGEYLDLKLGFALALPGPGWRFRQETPAGLEHVGSFVRWTLGQDVVGVVAICMLDAGQDEEWFLDFLQQLARDQMGMRDEPEERQTELAGRPARHLSYKRSSTRFDFYLLVRDRTIYAFLAGGRGSKLAALDRVKQSFRLLD